MLAGTELPAGFSFGKFNLLVRKEQQQAGSGPRGGVFIKVNVIKSSQPPYKSKKETESPPYRFYRLNAGDRENVARAGLNIRTFNNIFEKGQKQYKAVRIERQARRKIVKTTRKRPSRARKAQIQHGVGRVRRQPKQLQAGLGGNRQARPGNLFKAF